MNELALNDIMALGQALAESKYFSDAKEASQAVVKVLAGQELGIGPIAAMSGLYVVKGNVVIGGNIMASLIKSSTKYAYKINVHTNEACEIEFFENGESIGTSQFTIEDAERASLLGGDNWKHYPKNMLFNRALSNGAKWFCPDLFNGQSIYTLGEIEDEPENNTVEAGLVIENSLDQPNEKREISIKALMGDDDYPAGSPVKQAEWINAKINEFNMEIEPVTGKEVIALRE